MTPFLQGIPFDNEAVVASLARYERGAASPGMVREIFRGLGDIDARALLGGIQTKTLVLHSTGDPTVPIDEGRRLAEGIPGATFVEHEADYHWLFDGRKLWFMEVRIYVGLVWWKEGIVVVVGLEPDALLAEC